MITFYVISLCAKVMRRIAGVSASRTSRVAAWMNMNAALPAPTKVSLEVGSIMLYATSGKEPKVALGCALSVFRFGKQGCRLTSFPVPFEAVAKIRMVPLRRIADGEGEEEWYWVHARQPKQVHRKAHGQGMFGWLGWNACGVE